jgi:hypothetical protein
MTAMTALGPGIGIENVENSHRTGCKYLRDDLNGVSLNKPNIGKSGLMRPAVDFAKAKRDSVNPKKIDVWITQGASQKESAAPTSDIDLQWPRGRELRGDIQTGFYIRGGDNQDILKASVFGAFSDHEAVIRLKNQDFFLPEGWSRTA